MTSRTRWVVAGVVVLLSGAALAVAMNPQDIMFAMAQRQSEAAAQDAARKRASAPSVLPNTGPVHRTFPADSGWERLWIVGSDSTSDTWVEPRKVVFTQGMVVVLDDGTREIRALDARTGALRLLLKPTGQGPGEFTRPSLLASTPTGFAVLDQANARLSAFTLQGKLEWDAVIEGAIMVRALCIARAPDSHASPLIRAYRYERDSSVMEYDTTGMRTAVRHVPRAAAQVDSQGFGYSAYISDAGPDGSCVLAPMFGAEWAVIPPAGAVKMYAFREPGIPAVTTTQERIMERSGSEVRLEVMQMTDTPHSARGALLFGDTAIIYAAHTRESRTLLLDYHLLKTGAYLFSRRLPATLNAVTVGPDGTLYGTRIEQDAQYVVALRPRRLSN